MDIQHITLEYSVERYKPIAELASVGLLVPLPETEKPTREQLNELTAGSLIFYFHKRNYEEYNNWQSTDLGTLFNLKLNPLSDMGAHQKDMRMLMYRMALPFYEQLALKVWR